jgi:lysozyme
MSRLRPGLVLALALAGCNPPGPWAAVDEAQMVCPKGPVVKGVDVSHYDGAIDWGLVKAAGISFAIIKATENINFIDPEFAANWKFAGMDGIIRGGYHFLRPEVDPVAQADYFLATLGPSLPGDLPPALDLEVTDGLSGAAVAQSALAFVARLQEKTGRTPIIYTSASFMSSIGNPTGFAPYVLWVAHWTNMCPNLPPAWMDWSFWQNGDTGVVNGIPGQMVDVDQFNGTLADLQKFAGMRGAPDGGADGGGGSGSGGSGGGVGGVGAPEDAGTSGGAPPPPVAQARSGCSFSGSTDESRAGALALFGLLFAASLRRRSSRPGPGRERSCAAPTGTPRWRRTPCPNRDTRRCRSPAPPTSPGTPTARRRR